jgi:hypothetical protein
MRWDFALAGYPIRPKCVQCSWSVLEFEEFTGHEGEPVLEGLGGEVQDVGLVYLVALVAVPVLGQLMGGDGFGHGLERGLLKPRVVPEGVVGVVDAPEELEGLWGVDPEHDSAVPAIGITAQFHESIPLGGVVVGQLAQQEGVGIHPEHGLVVGEVVDQGLNLEPRWMPLVIAPDGHHDVALRLDVVHQGGLLLNISQLNVVVG